MTAQPTGKSPDPLHGITLENLLTTLVKTYGWEGLSAKIDLKCFSNNPSIKSSLTFLRKTPWARTKVERLYIKLLKIKPVSPPPLTESCPQTEPYELE